MKDVACAGVKERPPYIVLERSQDGTFSAKGLNEWDSSCLGDDFAIAASWKWNGKTLIAQTGQLNIRMLFWGTHQDKAILSTSLVTVTEFIGQVSTDFPAVACFMRLGFFIENDTPFKEITTIPPNYNGTLLGINFTNIRQTSYPRFSECALRGAVLERHYGEAFRASIRTRAAHGDLIHPLSGGRDSRHILFELLADRRRPRYCITADLPPSRDLEDTRIARLLCERLGLEHRTVPLSKTYFQDLLEKNKATSLCADEHTWAMPLARQISMVDCTIFDGIGGDVLSAGLFSTPDRIVQFRSGRLDELANNLLGDNEAFLETSLEPNFLSLISRSIATERLVKVLNEFRDFINPVAGFFFWNRTRREIAQYSLGLYGHNVRVQMPFLEMETFGMLSGLSAELLSDKNFHTRTIARMHPELSDIPYTKSSSDPTAMRQSNSDARRWSRAFAIDTIRYLIASGQRPLLKYGASVSIAKCGWSGKISDCWIDIEKLVWLNQVIQYSRAK